MSQFTGKSGLCLGIKLVIEFQKHVHFFPAQNSLNSVSLSKTLQLPQHKN